MAGDAILLGFLVVALAGILFALNRALSQTTRGAGGEESTAHSQGRR
jgi:hypothetical protein